MPWPFASACVSRAGRRARAPLRTEAMSDRATVLYVDNSSTFGGAINALADLLRALDTTRVAPVVLSAQSPDFLASAFPGIHTVHWPVRLMWVHDPVNRVVERLPGMSRGPLRMVWG